MKEHPILMNGTAVKATLEGHKTQTRRLIKPCPPSMGVLESARRWKDGWWRLNFAKPYPIGMGGLPTVGWRGAFKYGDIGDKLWLRETFTLESNFNLGTYPPPFDDGRPVRWVEDEEFGRYWQQPHYRATDPPPELYYPDREDGTVKWTPSIHMPRWACRIELGITGVRVERIKDTSFDDAIAEGCPMEHMHDERPPVFADGTLLHQGIVGPVAWFADLWDSIYAKQGRSFNLNPWVWVLDFKVV